MKLQHLRVLGATLLVAFAALPATAAEKPKPPKTTAKTVQTKLSPQELFRQQMQSYLAAVEERRLAIEEINRTFAASVKSAQQAFKATRAIATTAEAKTAAKKVLEEAISTATVTRQAALDKLEPLPQSPERPARKTNPAPTSKP